MFKKLHSQFLISFILTIILGIGLATHCQTQDIKLSEESDSSLQLKIPDVQTDSVIVNGSTLMLNKNKNGNLLLPMNVNHKGELMYIKHPTKELHSLYHISQASDGHYRIQYIPLWLSILPPLIAIGLALIFKEVNLSLFTGLWSGVFIAGGMRIESFYYFFHSIFNTISEYIVYALTDTGHISVILFSILIGGMVAIISKNGGMAGIVGKLSKYATDDRSTQFITWLLGVAIFFDDYANTLIVGNTMRSATDKFSISREKLAYIVDSTAAPIASVAFITTWIGAELGYIDSGIAMIENWDFNYTPYSIFIGSLKYSYYPLFCITLMLFIIYMRRDFGPMLKAERRARNTGQVSPARTQEEDEPDMENLDPVKNAPNNWLHAFLPIMTVILGTIYGLIDTGLTSLHGQLMNRGVDLSGNSWSEIWSNLYHLSEETPGFLLKMGLVIGSADSYVALLWSSLAGVIVAIIITVSSRTINLTNTMHHFVTGIKTMLPAVIILTLAWSLALTTEELHTADYLSSILKGSFNPLFLPSLIFVLAAFISFATGSSWSTMAILYPIAIPTTWYLAHSAGLDDAHSYELLLNVIATTLAASVLGDHCSPISDTTILSSLASDCNHIDHVNTQLPYALTAGVVAFISVTLSTYWGEAGWHNVILAVLGIFLMYIVVRLIGKKVPKTDSLVTQED